jgi:aminoglycoside phosphotransferase family enzyme/predicted kinase
MVNHRGETDLGQAKALNLMGRPQTYDPPPATVECIETHASYVFLAGEFAYKVKRAVKYPFLDFSTLEKRHRACLNELRINRRTAPHLYLEVVPISEEPDGTLSLRGRGKPVEWLLVMRRFAQEALYDRMAAEGRLTLAAMGPLADVIGDFHDAADRVLTQDQAVLPLAEILTDNETVLARNVDVFACDSDMSLPRDFARTMRDVFTALSPLLRARARDGYVRHCHGDLHLRNIVEIGGRPVLFDALEFDDSLATIDVLYDLAFLLMDLGKRGLGAHANAVLNAYLDRKRTGNLLGLAALPFFLSLRAMIRAKVELLRAQNAAPETREGALAEARAYFDLACAFLVPVPARVVAIGGLSGTGKSAVARAIAPEIGAFPGAVIVRSDVERKHLFGVAPRERLPERAYAQGVSDQVYAMCRKRAALALEAGWSVIVDAVQAKPEERQAVAALAEIHGVPFTGLWLEAPAEVLRARVWERQGDVSDATPRVVEAQLAYDLGPMAFDKIDASGSIDDVAALCLERIAADD